MLIGSLVDQGRRAEATAITTEVFRKQDGYAFPLVSQALRDSSGAWTLGEKHETVAPNLVESVLNLASCDFGRYCGADSNELLFMCATTGFCPRTIQESVLTDPSLGPGDKQQIEHFRDILVAAVRANRFDLLNLSGVPGR